MQSQCTAPTPTCSVSLTRPRAYALACSLVETAHDEADSFGRAVIDGALEGLAASADAQAAARRLMRVLGALEAVGYPHAHAWQGCETLMEKSEEEIGPWGRTMLADLRERHHASEPCATPEQVLTGDGEYDAAIGVLTAFEAAEEAGASTNLPAPLRAALLRLSEAMPR